MAKIYGINGVITGKLGAAVYAVRNGEQISRQYQPVVFNPSTPAQIASRAKLKLMSQLSAVLGPYIAIRRNGSVSARNMFVKKNYLLCSYASNTASVNLEGVTITAGIVGLNRIVATREGTNITAVINGNSDLSRVVFIAFAKQPDQSLRFEGQQVISSQTGNTWATEPFQTAAEVVIYAYGIRDNTNAARLVFGNMSVLSAQTIANLIVSRVLTDADVTLTETVAATVSANA